MKQTKDVRRANRGKVLRVLWRGGVWTKQEMAAKTGLSIPTCNSLLNELAEEGAVVGRPRPTGMPGRTATEYVADEHHEPMLLVAYDCDDGPRRHLDLEVVSTLGTSFGHVRREFDHLDYEVLREAVVAMLDRHPEVADIIVGTTSIAEGGVVRQCDIAELEGEPVALRLWEDTGRKVLLENDMHLKAYGYYCLEGDPDEVVTLANYPACVLPGTATVHRGHVITGAQQFAGMVGFLPYGMERAQYLEHLRPPVDLALVAQGIVSVICVVNPSVVVFTGALVRPRDLRSIERICARYVPRAYLPRFTYIATLADAYREGMRQRLIDQRTYVS